MTAPRQIYDWRGQPIDIGTRVLYVNGGTRRIGIVDAIRFSEADPRLWRAPHHSARLALTWVADAYENSVTHRPERTEKLAPATQVRVDSVTVFPRACLHTCACNERS
jgi:hypothetical protein